jgi:hypothetical protein
MHRRGLLRIRRDESLRYRILNISFNERIQICRQNVGKMVGDIRSKKQLLDLAWKALEMTLVS